MIIGIVIGYLGLMVVVGIVANKYIENMTDYLLAGRNLGLGLSTFTIAATSFGGGYVMGIGEAAYQNGLIAWWFGIGGGLGLILVGFLAKKARGSNAFSIPDLLEQRYGGRLFRPYVASILCVTLIGGLASQLLASKAVLSIVGLGTTKATAVIAFVFIAYTALGGLWAATITDFIQLIIASGGIIAAAVVVIVRLGGLRGFVLAVSSSLPGSAESYFNLTGSGEWSYIIWLCIPIMLTTLAGSDTYQRILATKDAKNAQRACWLAGVIVIIVTLFPAILGMAARALFPDLEEATMALPNIIAQVLHPVLAGVVMAAILAAIMSTADSFLTVATTNIAYDLIGKTLYRGKEVDEKTMLNISRLALICMGLLAVLVTLAIPSIIDILNMTYYITVGATVVPVVGGLLWKRANLAAGLASSFTGTAIAILSFVGVKFGPIPDIIVILSLGIIVFVIVTLAAGKKICQSP